jgi:tetratricopeptide (TPR) repeat protein
MMSLRDGLTGGLVARLADQGWHIVAGQADDANQEPQQIGARRGVRYLLGGTLQGGEARIRLTIHLTDASTGQELWVQRYDRETGDLFQLQDQLVNSIGHDLFDAVLRVEYRRLREVPDDELDAWGLCARAQRPVIDKASRERVLELLERAVNLDPRFAMAHSVYGAVVAQIIFNQFTHNIEKYSKLALEHTDRALALAPNNVVVLSQAALVQRIVGDPDDALRLAQRESQITGQPSASLLAALMVSGRFDEALEIGNAQPELVVSSELVAANMVMKRFDQAYEWARRATTLEPDAFLNWLFLAAVQAQLGQAETAQVSLGRARAIVPTISLDLFEDGLRVAWRRDDIVDAIMGGFRKLGVQ